MRRWRATLAMVIGAAAAAVSNAAAQGGPPLLTDDPGTPGSGQWEINLAMTGALTSSDQQYEVPLIDVNYGLGERVQLKVEGPFEADGRADGPLRSGLNTVEFGVKWRFLDQGRLFPLDVSTYPQLELDRHGAPEYLLPVEIAREFGRFAANAEAGASWEGRAPEEWFYGLALGFQAMRGTEVLSEAHATTERDGSGTETIVEAGLRQQVRGVLVMASAGHSLWEPAGEPARTIVYLGVSYQTALRREARHD